jgi:hypothetical protein
MDASRGGWKRKTGWKIGEMNTSRCAAWPRSEMQKCVHRAILEAVPGAVPKQFAVAVIQSILFIPSTLLF